MNDFDDIDQIGEGINKGPIRKQVTFTNGIEKKHTRTRSLDSHDKQLDRRRVTVNSDRPRQVRLTFTNTGRQKAVIYLERPNGQLKKVKLVLSNASFKVPDAFKFDTYLIKALDKEKKETEVLRVVVTRNMHVLIPPSPALLLDKDGEAVDMQKVGKTLKTTISFTNNIN